MRSMTGYGKGICELKDKIVTIEIKSLNSKQLDIYTRIPSIYREKDLDMRNIISQQLKRGKVELTVTIEVTDTAEAGKINAPVIKEYFKQFEQLGNELDIDYKFDILQVIMRLPETIKLDKEELDKAEWEQVKNALGTALDAVDSFREQEGAALKKDIQKKVNSIEEILSGIKAFESERINALKQRITHSLQDITEVDKVDSNRFEQELIYYLEKFDINEEKVRLKNHCKYFLEVSEQAEPIGKKLGFISQEMGREINTIGSKANHAEIQKLVVSMKDDLEKIKEQSLNVL